MINKRYNFILVNLKKKKKKNFILHIDNTFICLFEKYSIICLLYYFINYMINFKNDKYLQISIKK